MKCGKCGESVAKRNISWHLILCGRNAFDDIPSPHQADPHRQYAKNLINSSALLLDERKAYGTLINDFTVTAELWSTYLGTHVTPAQVTQLMVLLKIGRTKSGVYVEDNYADQIGYAGITAALAHPDTIKENYPFRHLQTGATIPQPLAEDIENMLGGVKPKTQSAVRAEVAKAADINGGTP